MSTSPFDPAPNRSTVGQSGIQSSFNVLCFSLVRFAIQFTSLIVLARLLLPSDYGLMGMIASATSLAALFRDMGLSVATIQKPDLKHTDINDAFWLNIYASTGLLLILWTCTPLISSFYSEPRLNLALPIVSITFVFSGSSVQPSALLRRQMRFFTIGIIETSAVVGGFLSSLGLALLGAGYWSLVAGAMVMEGLTCALLWANCEWRATKPTRFSHNKNLMHVGSHMLGINIISYFSSNLDRVLIGHSFGNAALGLYTRSVSIVSMPTLQLITPISSVMLPMFSRLRDHPVQYEKAILSSLRLMIAFTAPAVALLVAFPAPAVSLLLGKNWVAAAAILPILALSYATQFLPNNLGLTLIVAGRFRQTLVWNGIHLAAVIVGMGIGLHFGLIGVVTGYTVAVTLTRFPLLFALVGSAAPASNQNLWMACVPLWLCAALSGILARYGAGFLPDLGPLLNLTLAGIMTGISYISLLCIIPTGHDVFRDSTRIIKELSAMKKRQGH